MATETLGISINIVNVIAVVVTLRTLVYSALKCYKNDTESLDYSFYMFCFIGSICLTLANAMALYRSYMVYICKSVDTTEVIALATYVDRICMTFAFIIWDLHSRKFTIKWFEAMRNKVRNKSV